MSPFWLYWSASTTSKFGSGITALALPLVALYSLDASSLEVGLVAGSSYVGWALLGLPAGPICQMVHLRRLQVGMDLTRAATVLSLPVAHLLGTLTLAHLIAAALIISCCSVLFSVGNASFLPSVVPKSELKLRNSWMSGMDSATTLAGPSLGGVLVQILSAPLALIIDAISYLISALLLARVPTISDPVYKNRPPMLQAIREGWVFIVHHPVLRPCLLDATASNFVAGALMTLLPLHVVREMGGSAAVLGIVLAAEGLGGIIGAAVTPAVSRRLGSARATLVGAVASTVMLLCLPAAVGPAWWIILTVGMVGYAVGVVVASVNTRTFRQIASPPELLSRVVATNRFISWGIIPVGAVAAGWVAQSWGTTFALACASAVAWISPVVLYRSPVRLLRDLEDFRLPAIDPVGS